MKRRIVGLVLIFVMLTVITSAVLAQDSATFKDVGDDHWAKEAIELMVSKGIISGYDGYFRPDDTVSRAEFAKMLVKTLDLTEINPSTPSFTDVAKNDWFYVYVESARNYLTGFGSGSGFKFKPDEESVREDMAVAVVKGLYAKGEIPDPGSTDMTVLNNYTDESSVSENLRMYVAAAINEGIMVGSSSKFSPMGHLTRAEAATLLARLIDEEQKIVFDDTKVVIGDEDTMTLPVSSDRTPFLVKTVRDSDVVLEWSQVPSEDFNYYKVVLSKSDSTPSYPDDGYCIARADVTNTSVEIESGMSYNGGDFDGVIKGGETYYAAVTAVFDEGKSTYTSNVEKITVPGTYEAVNEGDKTPSLTYDIETNGVKLNWTQVPKDGFKYYKVVLSQTKEQPYYPDYGYLTYISNTSTTSYLVQAGAGYNDGSKGGIGGKVKQEGYYMTITAVYSSGKYTSNSVYVTVP